MHDAFLLSFARSAVSNNACCKGTYIYIGGMSISRAPLSLFQTIETETNRGRFEEFATFLSGNATAVNELTAAAAATMASRKGYHRCTSEARRGLGREG